MKLHILFAALLFAAAPLTSLAQATRTWVSGVGDDVNPCSRTAPGKTFAGAISKTAAGGVISVLDPGGYGAVTITKSITLDGGGIGGSILASGTNGIVINAAETDVVTIRNLSIDGAGTGLNGIRILNAGTVHIINCSINGFTDAGIVIATPGNSAQVVVDNCTIMRCEDDGIALTDGTATVRNTLIASVASSNTAPAVDPAPAVTTYFGNGLRAAAGTKLSVENCTIAANNFGITADGIVYLSGSTVTNNAVLGLKRTSPGSIVSLRNNRIMGNAVDGKVTKSIPQR
jgi:hypothetical protein